MGESSMPVEGTPGRGSLYAFRGIGRFVFAMQWWMPPILTFWVLFGRGFVGAVVGWVAIGGVVTFGPALLLALYVPPNVTRRDVDVRRSRATRFGYSVVMMPLWGVALVGGLVLPDADDGLANGSALSTWTRGAFTYAASGLLTVVVAGLTVAGAVIVCELASNGADRPADPSVIERHPRSARPGTVRTAFWLWWVAMAVAAASGVERFLWNAQLDFEYVSEDVPWMVMDAAVIIVGCVFVMRLRSRSRLARTVLSAAAAVVLATEIFGSQMGSGPSRDILVAFILVIATVLLFLPPSNAYFPGKTPAAASPD